MRGAERPMRTPMRTCPVSARPRALDEIKGHSHVLTPGRYVGAAVAEADDIPFEERFAELKEDLGGHSLPKLRN